MSKCAECGARLPEEIEPGAGVYCDECGHGQHVATDGGRDGLLGIVEATVPMPVEDDAGEPLVDGNKTITDARLTLQDRAPSPAKRILTLETRDGWRYRFQRYGHREAFKRFDRARPDGSVDTSTGGVLPGVVEDYAAAVEAAEIVPEIDAILDAQATVNRAGGPQAVATDGGQDDRDDGRRECRTHDCDNVLPTQLLDVGKCPECINRERIAEARSEAARRGPLGEYDDPAAYGDRL